ncbi:hypothetical protein TrRE_jg1525, partial [Triparma retinervis]
MSRKGTKKVRERLEGCNQCTVNEYEPGQGIGGHVDTESAFGEELISVSLGSGCVMEFREVGGKGRRKDVWLGRGSLVSIKGEARYKWTHAIGSRKTDKVGGKVLKRGKRISLTFRSVLNADGSGFMEYVDSGGRVGPTLNSQARPNVEGIGVVDFYNNVALQWTHTRSLRGILWPRAVNFLGSLPKG